MNRENLDFLESMFPFSKNNSFSILIVNQSQKKKINTSRPNIKIINSSDIGLSKSRNLALKNATGKLCVIADDDVIFKKDFAEKIIEGFSYFKEASCIQFCSEKSEGIPLKKYATQPIKNLSWLELLNVSSIELVMKLEDLRKHRLYFNETFGLGAKFAMGEEQVFLGALKKHGLQVSYFPKILNIHTTPSSIEKVTIKERYQVQGAMTHAIFGKTAIFWVLLKIYFDVKQKTLSLSDIKKALQEAHKGKSIYNKLK